MKGMETFGEFINQKRLELKISMRDVASALDISAPFLSDVEKGRRNPFEFEKLTVLAEILKLSEEEKNKMMDLAGESRNTVAPDLPDYIKDKDYVSAALRTARDLDASEEEWMKFVEDLKRRKG